MPDFVTYDEFEGPELDPARWSPARLPLPGGGEHIPLDPGAQLFGGDGEGRVTIPRFSLSHHALQAVDSPKYLVFSTRDFELPAGRPATFAADLAVENIGGEPADYRRGMAAFHDFDGDFTRLRTCELTLDRSSSTATWRVDGRTVYEAPGTVIPERARIGFGIWTMLPIRDGRIRSLDGQGMAARWRRFRVRGVDADALSRS